MAHTTRSAFSALTVLVLLAAAGPTQGGSLARSLLGPSLKVLSGKAIVVTQEFRGQPPMRLLLALTDKDRVQIVSDDPNLFENIRTGMDIEVTGDWPPGTAGDGSSAAGGCKLASCFKAAGIRAWGGPSAPSETAQVLESPPRATAGDPAPAPVVTTLSYNKVIAANITTLFIPIVALNQQGAICPGTTAQDVSWNRLRNMLFAPFNPGGFASVGSTFNRCSNDRSKVMPGSSLLANTVQLPCSGTSNGVRWSFSRCGYDELMGWADAADDKLRAQGNITLDDYDYRVYFLPPNSQCGFVGTAYIGCDPSSMVCRAWVSGAYWDVPQAIVHQLGHLLFMDHAENQTDPYGDSTCPMGSCCFDRCFNTPHSWQMGWITMQQLDGATLAPGQTVSVSIASQSNSTRSGLRIVPSWAPGVDPIFLGFRTAVGGDSWIDNVDARIDGLVHVYTAPINGTYDAEKTLWRETLDVGESWTHPTAGITAKFSNRPDYSTAALTITRTG